MAPNSIDILVGGLLGEKTIRWHLSGLHRNLHWLAYSFTIVSAFLNILKLGPIRTMSSAKTGLPNLMKPIVQPVPEFSSFCSKPSIKKLKVPCRRYTSLSDPLPNSKYA